MPHWPRWHSPPAFARLALGSLTQLFGIFLASAANTDATKFDIPRGPATQTLKQFSAQSGVQLAYATDLVRDVTTNGIRESCTPLVALEKMVAGTPLTVITDEKPGAFAISRIKESNGQRQSPVQPAAPDRTDPKKEKTPKNTMKPKNPVTRFGTWIALAIATMNTARSADVLQTSKSAEEEKKKDATVLSVFEVRADKDEGYRSTQTLQGAATLTNLRDTPNSISVINRELIDDLIAVDVREISFYTVTGEAGTNAQGVFGDGYVFRGITGNIALRDGVTWFTPVDSYNLDRVEILRGPTAFLYGEGTAGGLVNQLTKTALPTNHQKMNLIFGSHDLYRVELDLNRRLNDKLSLRAVMAYQDGKGFQRHAGREFKAAFLTGSYRPFENTRMTLSGELGRNHVNLGFNAMADQFSTTVRTAQTTAISDTTGGYTFLPGRGLFYRTSSILRRSTGTGLAVFDEAIQSRVLNFNGPDGQNRIHYGALNMQINQKVGENFNIQVVGAFQKAQRTARQRAGASADRIYIDTDRTLPNGVVNPYFNEYYTEFYNRDIVHTEPQHNVRATAVYDLDLKFTKQRFVAVLLYHDSDPQNEYYTETVDPKSANFVGSLGNPENSLAAYQANRTAHSQNFFYRRYYLKDGDGTEITAKNTVPGQSVMLRDAVADGSSGRLADEFYRTPGYGFGASGSFLKSRLHTLVGWRRSAFNVDRGRDFYNYVTGLTYRVGVIPGLAQPNVIRITKDRVNYGGVLHLSGFVAAYFNYAQSMALSSGVGGALLKPDTLRGPGLGDGNEYGLRWSFLGGRLESNWTYYITNQLRVSANPAIPSVVRENELARIFTDINPTGGDTQATKASGVEFETVSNLTKNWRLVWNYATNKLATANRYPDLRYFQARAKAQNTPTPETDAFLATVPDGTPLPGFTKIRSNLVTNYRFADGRLKGVSIGGGGQYRDMAYRGNFDLNRDGIAEQLWSPGYAIWNLYLGYRTKIFNRGTDINLNINNILDKSYYRSLGIGAGAWEDGRNVRIAVRTEL